MRAVMRCALGFACLLLLGCPIQGLDVGGGGYQRQPQPEPELDACTAAGGTCTGGGKQGCAPGTIGVAAACAVGSCCVVDHCPGEKTQAACEAGGCRWVTCPPNADCVTDAWCVADCRTTGCPSDQRCEQCWTTWECLPSNAAC